MRSTVWTIVLLALTFAIGWTARSAWEATASPPPPVGAAADGPRERADGRRDRRSGGRRAGPMGRFLDSVRQFSVELALTPEQEADLQGLFDGALAEIRAHETRIHEVMEDARPKLRAILSEAQRDRLDELVAARFRERSEQKVARTVQWARTEFGLDDDRVARLEAVLREYEDEKRRLFVPTGDAEPPPPSDRLAHEAKETRMKELRADLERRLETVLEAEERRELLRRTGGRHRFGADRDLVE